MRSWWRAGCARKLNVSWSSKSINIWTEQIVLNSAMLVIPKHHLMYSLTTLLLLICVSLTSANPATQISCASSPPLVCVLEGARGSFAFGRVLLRAVWHNGVCYVRITTEVHELELTSAYAVVFHKYGDISSTNGLSVGDRFNGSDLKQRALKFNTKNAATFDVIEKNVSLNSMLGRGIVVHEIKQGAKLIDTSVAQCVVGFANPSYVETAFLDIK